MDAQQEAELTRTIGARLRAFRKLQGVSQGKLADAVGITFQQVQKYESGSNRIAAARLVSFAHVLRVPVAAFYANAWDTSPGALPLVAAELLEGLRRLRIEQPAIYQAVCALVDAATPGRS